MKHKKLVYISIFLLSLNLTACNAKAQNDAGKAIDNAQNNTGKVIDTAQNNAEKVIDNAQNDAGKAINAAQNNAEKVIDNAQTTVVTYLKEFSYLPTYGNMVFQSITKPDKNKMVTGKYILKNTTTDKVLNDYSNTLTKNGWTVKSTLSQSNKPYSISAQKDKHIATLIPQQNGNDVILTITSI